MLEKITKTAVLFTFLALSPVYANELVRLETSLGDIEIELYPEQAPKTVDNFLRYVSEGFYDGLVFHRVIPGFVIQAGGMTGDFKARDTNAPIINESDNGLSNERGTLSMARTREPDSATSQFFINLQHNDRLDSKPGQPGYAVFARVTEGMDVVDRIAQVETTTRPPFRDVPVVPVVIEKATRIETTQGQ
ncbi:MAG: peptidylprolyl isomerase [Oceanospirillaceae bacterium]|nr:peptidylprolyl isomerase [Oceanospirillaceae bacterium]